MFKKQVIATVNDMLSAGLEEDARTLLAIAADADLLDEKIDNFLETAGPAMAPYKPRRKRKSLVTPKERLQRIRYYKKNKAKIAKEQKRYRQMHKTALKQRRKKYYDRTGK